MDYKGTRIKQYHKEGQAGSNAFQLSDSAIETCRSLCHAVLLFDALPVGFSNGRLRERFAQLLALAPDQPKPGTMTYQLRRLRLHGLIEHIPHTQRYRLTDLGLRVALFSTRTCDHLLRPGLGAVLPPYSTCDRLLRRAFDNTRREVDRWIQQVGMAA